MSLIMDAEMWTALLGASEEKISRWVRRLRSHCDQAPNPENPFLSQVEHCTEYDTVLDARLKESSLWTGLAPLH